MLPSFAPLLPQSFSTGSTVSFLRTSDSVYICILCVERMPVFTLCLYCIFRRGTYPPQYVFPRSDCFQMARANTSPISTQVIQVQPYFYSPVSVFVALSTCHSSVEDSVAVSILGRSPIPAVSRFLDFLPESLSYHFSHVNRYSN